MIDKWILDADLRPVPCGDLLRWAQWFEHSDRHVAETRLGRVRISTVFLGLNHQWQPGGEPLLYETMIFGGARDGEIDRYATWNEAMAGHAQRVAQIAARRRKHLLLAALLSLALGGLGAFLWRLLL